MSDDVMQRAYEAAKREHRLEVGFSAAPAGLRCAVRAALDVVLDDLDTVLCVRQLSEDRAHDRALAKGLPQVATVKLARVEEVRMVRHLLSRYREDTP